MRRFGRRWIVAFSMFGLMLMLPALWLRWPQAVADFAEVRAGYRPSEAYLLDRHGQLLDSKRVDFGARRFSWVALEQVSPALVDAIVQGEDRRFWHHGGVDYAGVLAALRDGWRNQRLRGASTISMQLASLLGQGDAARGRTSAWQRKLAQMRTAWSLEARWSKREILEAYLNLLSFRGEWQGVGAASWGLAGKAPSGLSVQESDVLAALLPSPSARPELIARRACARAQRRAADVDCAALDEIAHRLLANAGTSARTQRLAPHLAERLLRTPGERLDTTLDARLQRLAHDRLAAHLAQLADRNVRDGAAIVVDNASGEVLAYVASAGPNSRAAAVDGIIARRQAGSTLKPFLYQLAIERGYLTAASLLDDSPVSLDTASGAYLPQNYDRDFKGLVSVRTALASSLNIPAVRTVVLTGVEPFRARLFDLGYAGITRSGEFYGHALALGAAEVSLWEQAQAYRSLALGGLGSPLHLQPGDAANDAKEAARTRSDASSFIVSDMLSDRAARVLTFGLGNHLDTPFWSAVKTGTSKDMRDNWCIGFSAHYTVAVWVGNFEGDAMQDVSGVTGAGPVWNELMLALHKDVASLPPEPPTGVHRQNIQFARGIEPARMEWFLPGSESAQISPVTGRAPRIVSPAEGAVIALDPDIPERMQRVPIVARDAEPELRIKLNGQLLGAADAETMWRPARGRHALQLEDAEGRVLDRVQFSVR